MKPSSKKGEFRIISGRWHGRRLHFPDAADLRPTTDRTRETVFNWLAPVIRDAVCLDLFAGTGAFGFEALSRGAKHAVMIEKQPLLTTALKTHAAVLQCEDQVSILTEKSPQCIAKYCSQWPSPIDVVFLDPPFRANLIPDCCRALEASLCLNQTAYIYIETEKTFALEVHLPPNWQIIRQDRAGQVAYYLVLAEKGSV